jgi:signal transduction histidine kinase
MSFIHRHIVDPLRSGRTVRHLVLVVSAIPLGIVWFAFLVTGWSLGLGLLITLIGLPILFGVAAATRVFAELERRLLEWATGVRTARPGTLRQGSLVRSLRALAADPMTWREQGYLLLRFALGLPIATVVIAVAGAGLRLAAAPAYYWAEEVDVGFWQIDTFSEVMLVVPVGVAIVALTVPLVEGAAALWAAVARGVLGAPTSRDATGAPGVPTPRRIGDGGLPGLAWHVGSYIVLGVALVVIWVSTTPGGYFWPVWVLMPLGTILAIHAAIVGAPHLFPDAGRAGVGLARTAGICAAVGLLMVGIWLMSTPGETFWPVWVLLGLGVVVAVSALRVILGIGVREQMAERIDVLTTTRAGAVDAQAAELRRIERDLHDGAQARLVALAMDLGMAREKLRDAPPDAQTLVAGAHEEAKRALVELRDLARGIHPAVLTDRGLEAALGSLTGASPIPVRLDTDLERRLDPALEAAAYFAVAEAVTNAVKHSGAGVIDVSVARRGRLLRVRVADDGVGGADPGSDGLLGLRRRVEAHDGTLHVISPPGAGTTIEAVIPCAS